MRTGQISVQSENIFPIIKKFLYTDQEIFLRELVSNAVDATKKLSTLSRVGEFEDSIENCKVEISFDEKAKTLTISDSGIGMTEEEVEKYITQLAFSGAREFAEQWKDKDPDQMIGHFGLGFYSAFMVSKMVTIETKSYQKGAQKKLLADELADVLFVVVCIANQTQTDLTKALKLNLEKKTKRDLQRHKQNSKLNSSFKTTKS